MIRNSLLLLFVLCVFVLRETLAQDIQKSDTSKRVIDQVKDSRISQELLKSVTRKQPVPEVLNIKSEEIFLPYDGKVVRKIIVNHIGFEKSITDTTSIKSKVAKVANAIHVDTKEWVIRDHIFFQEKKPLNAYKLADNERFLRDLDFILDARIFIVPLVSTDDSVDVLVLTRDVFSVGGSVSPHTNGFKFRTFDANVFGMGQRLQYNGYYDADRNPVYTHEFYYRKSSVFGSLINMTMGFTQLNTGSSYGDEQEQAYYLRLDRPLVSPYSRMAGGIELSKNWSQNFDSAPDSIFRNYRYSVMDFWMGYNIGINKSIDANRSRHFISGRFFQQQFDVRPNRLYDQLNPLYNSRTSFLGSFTFFKQNFYKTQYVYGFGRTEDVPYGQTMSLLGGWQRLMGIQRPYFGIDAEKSFVHRKGNFYTVTVRTGAFPYNDQLQDATILLSGRLYSKLKYYKRVMVRRSFDVDFTYVFNQKTNTLLDINNSFGIEGFVADSLLGTKRLHGRYEMIIYTNWKVLGFKMAPILFTDLAFIAPKDKIIFYDKPYMGLGAGMRTRNENLIFGTIELKFFYYPRTVEDMSNFKVSLTSNLRIKYSGSFIKPPSFIVYN